MQLDSKFTCTVFPFNILCVTGTRLVQTRKNKRLFFFFLFIGIVFSLFHSNHQIMSTRFVFLTLLWSLKLFVIMEGGGRGDREGFLATLFFNQAYLEKDSKQNVIKGQFQFKFFETSGKSFNIVEKLFILEDHLSARIQRGYCKGS